MNDTLKRSKKPIIGLSASLITIDSGPYFGRERSFIGRDYILAVEKAGGIPIVLPVITDFSELHRVVQWVDGIILSGGHDVHPFNYNEEPQRLLDSVSVERDRFDFELVKLSKELKKPLFGICRGLQLINVAFGGTLHQDIPSNLPNSAQHSQKSKPDIAIHTVDVKENTKLHQMIEETEITTNSFHHQSVKDLAPNFIANAKSKDGLIEGIEMKGDDFIVGVQWHPEMMIENHPRMQKLFTSFINIVKK